MNIQYSKKKEEMRRDPLIEWLQKAKEFLSKNNKKLSFSIIAVIVCIGIYQTFSYVQKSNEKKTRDEFGIAMNLYTGQKLSEAQTAFKAVIEKHPSTSQATYSAYLLGQMLVADKKYDDAIAYFEKAYKFNGNAGFVPAACLEALGDCYDAKDDVKKAISSYEKALQDKSYAYRFGALNYKTALLYKKLGNKDKVLYYCNEIATDSLAGGFKQKAENLKVESSS